MDSFFLILVSLRVNEIQFCDFGFPLTATTNGKWKTGASGLGKLLRGPVGEHCHQQSKHTATGTFQSTA